MLVKYENRQFNEKEKFWLGEYKNLNNISHWHLANEIIYIEKGKATVFVENKTYNVSKGNMIFCQSGKIHYIKSHENSIVFVLLFDSNITFDINNILELNSPILKFNYDKYFNIIKKEYKNKQKFFEQKIISAIITITAEMFRKEKTSQYNDKSNHISTKYKLLLNDIDKNYEFYTFNDALNFMGLSKSYFSKLFKNINGLNFSKYLNMVRIEKAINMLLSENCYKITQISTKCGFDTIRHFNRVFKQITGYTPSNLPKNYTHKFKPIKTNLNIYNPTLSNSILLE